MTSPDDRKHEAEIRDGITQGSSIISKRAALTLLRLLDESRAERDQWKRIAETHSVSLTEEMAKSEKRIARCEALTTALQQAETSLLAAKVFVPWPDMHNVGKEFDQTIAQVRAALGASGAETPRDPRCTCLLVRRSITPEEHDDSCPVVAASGAETGGDCTNCGGSGHADDGSMPALVGVDCPLCGGTGIKPARLDSLRSETVRGETP